MQNLAMTPTRFGPQVATTADGLPWLRQRNEQTLDLEVALACERMKELDPWAGPPSLPTGTRVELMLGDCSITRWEFASHADWHLAVGWRVQRGSLTCADCGDPIEVYDVSEDFGIWDQCENCSDTYAEYY